MTAGASKFEAPHVVDVFSQGPVQLSAAQRQRLNPSLSYRPVLMLSLVCFVDWCEVDSQ